MVVTFEKRKKDFLAKDDKSSIGSWDKPIVPLCNKLNKNKDYYSLSSCSGRVVLLRNVKEKKHGLFVFRSHEKISLREISNAIEKAKSVKEGVLFKQEPGILHVACRDLVSAKKLLVKANLAGWKHSGIIAISDNRIVVELNVSESLAFPVVDSGKVLVDDGFLKILVRESNARLSGVWKKINKLAKLV
jgi:tRNA wybutosine-synthesizing protein 3